MKKYVILLCFVMFALLLYGCSRLTPLESSVTETTGPCNHERFTGLPRYEYGEYCDQPTSVYMTCALCGEEVFNGKMLSTLECHYSHDAIKVVREATCTECGISQAKCWRCEKVFEWELPVKDHTFLWFYQEDLPRCACCGLVQEICSHDYELRHSVEPQYARLGVRYYSCKLCGEEKDEFYDQEGDLDLNAPLKAVCDMAKEFGFQVLSSGEYEIDYYKKVTNHAHYYASSVELSNMLTQMGCKCMESFMDKSVIGNKDPSSFYLWANISYSVGQTDAKAYTIEIYLAPAVGVQ